MIQTVSDARTTAAVVAVKMACKTKFPKIFDFDVISSQAGVKKWSLLLTDPDAKALNPSERTALVTKYFDRVIKPRIHEDYVDEARSQFDAFARLARHSLAASAPLETSASQAALQ